MDQDHPRPGLEITILDLATSIFKTITAEVKNKAKAARGHEHDPTGPVNPLS